jgi:arylsulfatase A-like enzyme
VHTGVYPLVHQVTCHQNRAPWNLPQLAELLQQRGYYTAVTGHYEDDRNLSRGWHEQSSFLERGKLIESFKRWATLARRDVAWSSGPTDYPYTEGNDFLVAERAIRMADQIRAAGAPYFLHVCLPSPHPPYFVPEPYSDLVDPNVLPLPPRGSDEGLPDWQARCRDENGTARATGDDVRKLVAVYYGMIAYADAQMQRIWDALETKGLLENTWVIVGADHGDYTGEKGLFNKSESLYECLLHVPLIVRAPDGTRAPRNIRIDHLVNTVDLFPTILGLAGADVPAYTQGQDLMPWLDGGADAPLHDCLFAQVGEYHGFLKTTWPGGMPESGRHPSLLQGARNGAFSYVRDPDYGDEAYDLRSDPHELVNLLKSPAQEPEGVTELRRHVDRFEAESLQLREALGVVPGDRGFVEGWE